MSDLGSLLLSVSRELASCDSAEELSEIFYIQIRMLGLTCAASGLLTGARASSANPFHFNNWPLGWRKEYAAENYLHIDPLAKYALTSGAPVSWTDAMASLPPSDPGHRVYVAAARHGFTEGMVIPLRNGAGDIGMVALGGDRPRLNLDDATFLVAISSAVFFAAEALRPAAQSVAARALFTPRELECIDLLGTGLTDAEIGTVLGVSRETVISHMENARRKAGARSRAHLLSIAMRYRRP